LTDLSRWPALLPRLWFSLRTDNWLAAELRSGHGASLAWALRRLHPARSYYLATREQKLHLSIERNLNR